jgi:hypothetical protein
MLRRKCHQTLGSGLAHAHTLVSQLIDDAWEGMQVELTPL